MECSFNHNDSNYVFAVNYKGTAYYNPPMTLSVSDLLFILPFGNSDTINHKSEGNTITIVGENRGLDYISMVVIDLNNNSIDDCYISGNDLNDSDSPCFGIFDLELDDQIRVLENYIAP